MTINFGILPVRTSFILASDSDFLQAATTADGSNFPVTTVLQIRWLDAADVVIATWQATISGATAEFRKDKTDVAAVLAASPVQGRLFYEDGAGGPELLLAKGTVHDSSP